MSKNITYLIVVVLIVAGAFLAFHKKANAPVVPQTPTTTTPTTPVNNEKASDMIDVVSPVDYGLVTSPFSVIGQAKGTWYFEASFPVKLLDANGKVLAQTPAKAQGDWMTSNFVPFQATLIFKKPTTKTGTLILSNDNPSGIPANDKSVSIPVTFSQ